MVCDYKTINQALINEKFVVPEALYDLQLETTYVQLYLKDSKFKKYAGICLWCLLWHWTD